MNELFDDPLLCNDMETLQNWVLQLQELVLQYRGDVGNEPRLIELLYRVNANQGERLEMLKERLEIEHELCKVYKEKSEQLARTAAICLTIPAGSQLN